MYSLIQRSDILILFPVRGSGSVWNRVSAEPGEEEAPLIGPPESVQLGLLVHSVQLLELGYRPRVRRRPFKGRFLGASGLSKRILSAACRSEY